MTWFPFFSIGCATLGVLSLAAIPGAGDDLLVVFPADVTRAQIEDYLQARNLPLKDYRPELGHVVTYDPHGGASDYFYSKGARLVVNANYGATCRTLSTLEQS